jgi:hypothetical protein
VGCVVASAPPDEEPVTEIDWRRLAARDAGGWVRRGNKGISTHEVLANFGLTSDDFSEALVNGLTQVVASLNHPNIPRFMDWDSARSSWNWSVARTSTAAARSRYKASFFSQITAPDNTITTRARLESDVITCPVVPKRSPCGSSG